MPRSVSEVADLLCNSLGICRRWERKVLDAETVGFLALGLLLADFDIRTDANGVQRLTGLGAPFPKRLSKQGDGWHQEQNETLPIRFLLRDLQAGERLARPTGHDEAPSVPLLEVVEASVQGGLLVGKEGLLLLTGLRSMNTLLQGFPINWRVFQRE